MKNKTYLIGIIAIILIAGYIVYSNSSTQDDAKINVANSGDVQKVVISMKNANYYPNTITVKANQPVQISLDSSVSGCFRSFTIPELNIRKYLASSTDTLTFTPTEKGTYRFACSMGMGFGTLIVV